MTEKTEEKTKSKAKTFDLQAEMDNLKLGSRFEFRLSPSGDVVQGHYIDRVKLIPTSDGFKFRMERTDRGIKVRNIDYGWTRRVDLVDEKGKVYDAINVNAQGTKDVPEIEEKAYTMAEEVLRDCVNWLSMREAERLGNGRR